eukprot:m.55992 g.55992  ORF g.55992 m.55992 type:complete len:811 (-) comp12003_c1_seq1:21-2453(-)
MDRSSLRFDRRQLPSTGGASRPSLSSKGRLPSLPTRRSSDSVFETRLDGRDQPEPREQRHSLDPVRELSDARIASELERRATLPDTSSTRGSHFDKQTSAPTYGSPLTRTPSNTSVTKADKASTTTLLSASLDPRKSITASLTRPCLAPAARRTSLPSGTQGAVASGSSAEPTSTRAAAAVARRTSRSEEVPTRVSALLERASERIHASSTSSLAVPGSSAGAGAGTGAGAGVGVGSAQSPKAAAAPPKPTRQASVRSMRVDKSGVLVKRQRNSKRWKAFTVSLWCDKRRLFYFDSPTAMKPKGIIDLGGCSLFSLDDSLYGRPNCFQLIVCGSDVVFCADTEQEKTEWMSALQPLVGFSSVTAAAVNANTSAVVRSLSVCVVEAKDFTSKAQSVFCTLSISDVKVARTPTLTVKSNSAFWNEDFVFNNLSDGLESISVELFQRGKLTDQEMASGEVPLTTLQPGATNDRWLTLRTRDGHDFCAVRLKLAYEQETLLPLAEYAPIQRLLLSEDLAAPLLLADICHTHLNDVARNLLLVWRRVHHEVEMLDALTRRVIEAETDPATLFRGNTLASKALDHYMKMVAMPYLHSTLGKPVKDLFEERRSCELDPTRGGKSENAKTLLGHATQLACSVFDSVDRCPSTLRTVFARLRDNAVKKFPTSVSVKYTSVSGFVFLRLFCPAIINPKLFNMMPDHATEGTARSLMLVAKVIQNLANMSEFGQKEEFMLCCNETLTALRPRMQIFLDSLACPARSENTDTVFVTHPSRPLASLVRLCLNKQAEFAASPQPIAKKLLEASLALQAKAAATK